MKKLFCYILFLLCITAVAQPDSIKYTLTAGKPKVKKKSEQRWIEVPVTLTNTTKDTLVYGTWSCSWNRMYWTDSNDLLIQGASCDKNNPIFIKLPPGEHKTQVLKIDVKNKVKELNFRVSFNLIIVYEPKYLWRDWYELNKKKQVLWTKPITVKLK